MFLEMWAKTLTEILDNTQAHASEPHSNWWHETVLSGFLMACREAVNGGRSDAVDILRYWQDLEDWQVCPFNRGKDSLNHWQYAWIQVFATGAANLVESRLLRSQDPSVGGCGFEEEHSAFVQILKQKAGEFGLPTSKLADAFFTDIYQQLTSDRDDALPIGSKAYRIERFPLVDGDAMVEAQVLAEISAIEGWALFPDPSEILLLAMDEDFFEAMISAARIGEIYYKSKGRPVTHAVRLRIELHSWVGGRRRAELLKGRSAGGAKLRAIIKAGSGEPAWIVKLLTSLELPDVNTITEDDGLTDLTPLPIGGEDKKFRDFNGVVIIAADQGDNYQPDWKERIAPDATFIEITDLSEIDSVGRVRRLTFYPMSPQSPPHWFGWRDSEVAAIGDALAADGTPLILLTGPRGSGKSTLWNHVAEHLQFQSDGLAEVRWAPIRTKFSAAIQLDFQNLECSEEAAENYWLRTIRDQISQCQAYLFPSDFENQDSDLALSTIIDSLSPNQPKRLLLVFDNFEVMLNSSGEIRDPRMLKLLSAVLERKCSVHTVLLSKSTVTELSAGKTVEVLPFSVPDAMALLKRMDDSMGQKLQAESNEVLERLVRKAGCIALILRSFAHRLNNNVSARTLLEEPIVKISIDPETSSTGGFIVNHFRSLTAVQRNLALVAAALRMPQSLDTLSETLHAALPDEAGGIQPELYRLVSNYFFETKDEQYWLNAHYLDVITDILNGEDSASEGLIPDDAKRRAIYRASADHYAGLLSGYSEEDYIGGRVEWYYRLENDAYNVPAAQWIRCIAFIDPIDAEKQFAAFFLQAFDWFLGISPRKPCEQFLDMWKRTPMHRERVAKNENDIVYNRLYNFYYKHFVGQDRWPDLLQTYPDSLNYNSIPKVSDKDDFKTTVSQKLDAARADLLAIERHLGIPTEMFTDYELEDPTLNKVWSISAYLRAMCGAYIANRREVDETRWLLQKSISLSYSDEYNESVVAYDQIDLAAFELMQPEPHLDRIREPLLQAYETINVQNDLEDREVRARLLLTLGDLHFHLREQRRAFDCWRWGLYEQYCYLYWGQSSFADEYTRKVYLMFLEKLTGRLLILAEETGTVDATLEECRVLFDFFKPALYDEDQIVISSKFDKEVVAPLLEGCSLGIRPQFQDILAPPLPPTALWSVSAELAEADRAAQISKLTIRPIRLKRARDRASAKFWESISEYLRPLSSEEAL